MDAINLEEYEEINVGTTIDPKTIKVGKNITPKEKEKIKLVMKLRDMVEWSYDDLKAYKDDVI